MSASLVERSGIRLTSLRRLMIPLLWIAAVLQLSFLGYRLAQPRVAPRIPTRVLLEGDTLRWLGALTEDSTSVRVDVTNGRITVLLAFDTSCVWCDSIAPVWKEWSQRSVRPRLVGVARRSARVSQEYAEAHGWRLDTIVQLDRSDLRGTERALVGKTPWLFALRPDGTLLVAEHGSGVARVDSVLRLLVAAR